MRIQASSILLLAATVVLGLTHTDRSEAKSPHIFERTIVVSPVADDPEASGQALLEAVDSVDPDELAHWLIKIEPGTYDVGTASVTMKPWLTIEGSGRDATVIRGWGQSAEAFRFDRGVVSGADHATLRDLTVRCFTDSGSDADGCIALATFETSPRIDRVALEAWGDGTHWGVRNTNGSPRLEQVEITMTGGNENYGLVNAGEHARPAIWRSQLSAKDGAYFNVAIFNREGGLPKTLEDVDLEVAGGNQAIGFYDHTPGIAGETRWFDVRIQALGATQNHGILYGDIKLSMRDSEIEVGGGGAAIDLRDLGKVTVIHSEFTAPDTVIVRARDIRVASSWISGHATVQGFETQGCASLSVFDPVNGAASFFADQCPVQAQQAQVAPKLSGPRSRISEFN